MVTGRQGEEKGKRNGKSRVTGRLFCDMMRGRKMGGMT
jgi:hypothetical protein